MKDRDKDSIILMSKLAAYDKYYSRLDKKKAEYFRHDYVYRQNIGVRFFTLIGSFIVILFYFAHRIIDGKLDILDITGEVMADIIRVGIFVILVQFLYSMLGFLIFSSEYNEAKERIEEYFENMNKLTKRQYILKQIEERRAHAKEEPYGYYEPDDDEYFED